VEVLVVDDLFVELACAGSEVADGWGGEAGGDCGLIEVRG
jgi:hypothetical protein